MRGPERKVSSEQMGVVPDVERETEIARNHDQVISIVGDWAVHTYLDKNGNKLHRVGSPRKPLFSEEDIRASENEA